MERCRIGLQCIRNQTVLANRYRLRAAHGCRRFGGCQSEHRSCRLRQHRLLRAIGLAGLRRHQRRVTGHRIGLRARRQQRLRELRGNFVRQLERAVRRDFGKQRKLRKQLPLHRDDGLRRSDRKRHAQRRRRLLIATRGRGRRAPPDEDLSP